LAGKRLQLLKELVPGLARLAVLSDADIRLVTWNDIEGPAHKLGLQLQRIDARTAGDLDTAFAAAIRGRAGALFVMPAPLFVTHLKRIAELATMHRLPAMFHLREFAEAGGLVTYGPDRTDLFRRAPSTSTRFSRAPSRRTCRSSKPQSLCSSSTSRP